MRARARRWVAPGLALVVVVLGCGRQAESPAPGPFATARPDDPPLTESWRLPPGSSALRSGDLGSKPTELSIALMNDHAAAGVSHRIATRCTKQGSRHGVESLALRFAVGDDGAITSIEGDPAGAMATCVGDALADELSALSPLPAGAALMVLRFSTEPAP
jgi:hypothetical protein